MTVKLKDFRRELETSQEPVVSEIEIDKLLDNALLILYRELRELTLESAKGKLSPAYAKDLRDHTKLLFELKGQQGDWLKGVTDEQLKELFKRYIEMEAK